MNASEDALAILRSLDTDMLSGAGRGRVRVLLSLLRPLPRPLAEPVLVTLAVLDGLCRRARLRRALTWAADRGARGSNRWRIALALLANHGRFVAREALVGVGDASDLTRDVLVVGREHLPASGGALLLGFHLGPPKTWLALRALGFPVRFAGRLEAAVRDPRWRACLESGDLVRLPEGDPRTRLAGLLRIRQLLQHGALVYVTADGPFGSEAFRIDLAGGPLVVRSGWLALRRSTGVPTLPVLTYCDGRRRVIVIHPPLPVPADDALADRAACRMALTPLVEAYVDRHPTQCRWLAMPRWRRR
jgi:lauroyl/myristoyl acyltransferase